MAQVLKNLNISKIPWLKTLFQVGPEVRPEIELVVEKKK
jgi:hypothetical protein